MSNPAPVRSYHICKHCDHFLVQVPVTGQNWAGLECENEECVTVANRQYKVALEALTSEVATLQRRVGELLIQRDTLQRLLDKYATEA